GEAERVRRVDGDAASCRGAWRPPYVRATRTIQLAAPAPAGSWLAELPQAVPGPIRRAVAVAPEPPATWPGQLGARSRNPRRPCWRPLLRRVDLLRDRGFPRRPYACSPGCGFHREPDERRLVLPLERAASPLGGVARG